MTKQKRIRTERALARLENTINSGKVEPKDQKRYVQEILNIKANLDGNKKVKVVSPSEKPDDKWVIDIFSIKYGYVKQSQRRKNKGKSKKKMKRVKTSSLVKTVSNHPGLLDSYREGRMGMSPKTHTFRMRKIEPWII